MFNKRKYALFCPLSTDFHCFPHWGNLSSLLMINWVEVYLYSVLWGERRKINHRWCSTFTPFTFLIFPVQLSSVQSLSRVQLFATPWIAACQASLSITNSQSSLKLTSIKLVMPSSHLILCRSLLLLPPIPPNIRIFSNESTLCMRWPKYWNFSFSIIPSKEHPGLISFRMDWLDLLAVHGTLKSLLQHHSSKASILWRSAFFTVQLSHPYMTTGKTIALTRKTFFGKVIFPVTWEQMALALLLHLLCSFIFLESKGNLHLNI